MNKNICTKCGEENEPEYIYCKNCGEKLNAQENTQAGNPGGAYYENRAPKNSGFNPVTDNIDGIDTEEVGCFIGRKAHSILPKFSKMQITGSKGAWCWPVAILSFVFGPLGTAIWYFYRKMYKYAWAFFAFGILTTAAAVLFGSADAKLINDAAKSGVALSRLLNSNAFYIAEIIGAVNSIINIVLFILAGNYSLYLYKQFAIKKIIGYRMTNPDPRYYRVGLSAIGGTSEGMAALGVALLIVSVRIIMYIG